MAVLPKLLSWTDNVEEELRFPDRDPLDDLDRSWEKSVHFPFSIAKIRDEEFSFRMTNFFFRSPNLLICGLESAAIEIIHVRHDPNVFFWFRSKNSSCRSDSWGEYKTLYLEVSFKSMFKSKDNCGEGGNTEGEGVWQVVKGFAISLRDRDGCPLYNEKALCFAKELCNVDELLMDYKTYPTMTGDSNLYQLTLPIRVSVKVSEEDISIRISNPDWIKNILSEGLHSDFTIHVGEMEFTCRKSILAEPRQTKHNNPKVPDPEAGTYYRREISQEKEKLPIKPTPLLQQQSQAYESQYPQNPYFNPYVNPYNFHQYLMYGMPPLVPENYQTSGPSSSNSMGSNANDIYPSGTNQSHGMPIWPSGYPADDALGLFPPYGSGPQQVGNQNQITQPYGWSKGPMSQSSEGSLSPHGFRPGHPVPPNFGNMVSGAMNMQYLQAPSGPFQFPTTPFVPIPNGIEALNTPSKKRTTQNAADLVEEVTKKIKIGVKYKKPSVLSKFQANVEKSRLRSSTLSVKRQLERDTNETEQLKKCKEDSLQRSTRDARTIQISDTSNCEQIEKEESDSSCSISNTPSRCDSENNKIDERISGVTKVEELLSTKKVGETKNDVVEEKAAMSEATVNSRDQLSQGTTEPETDEVTESSPLSPSNPPPSTSINRTGGLVQRPKRAGGGRGVEHLRCPDSKWMEADAKKWLKQCLGYPEIYIQNNFEFLKKDINFEAVPDIWLAMQSYNIVLNDARNPKKTSGILSEVQQKLIVILHKLSSDLPNVYENLPKLVLEYFLIVIVPDRSHTFPKDTIKLEALGHFYGRLCGDIDKIDRSALTQRLIFDCMYWRSPHSFAVAHGIWRVNNANYFYLSFEQMALKDQAMIFTLMRPPRFNDACGFQTLRELLTKSFQVDVPDITYDQFVTSVVTAIRGFEASVSLDEGSEILGMLFIFGGINWTVNFLQTALATLMEDWRIVAINNWRIMDGVFAAVLRAIGYFCRDSVESHDLTRVKKLLEIFLNLDNKSDVLVAAIKECVSNIDATIQLNKSKKQWNWVYAKRPDPSTVRNTNKLQHKKKKNSSGKDRSPRASGGVSDRGQRVFKKTP